MNKCCELGLRLLGRPKEGERRECSDCGQKWDRLGGFWWPADKCNGKGWIYRGPHVLKEQCDGCSACVMP